MADRLTHDPRFAPGQGVVRYSERRSGLPCRARDVDPAVDCAVVFTVPPASWPALSASAARRDAHELAEHGLRWDARDLWIRGWRRIQRRSA